MIVVGRRPGSEKLVRRFEFEKQGVGLCLTSWARIDMPENLVRRTVSERLVRSDIAEKLVKSDVSREAVDKRCVRVLLRRAVSEMMARSAWSVRKSREKRCTKRS